MILAAAVGSKPILFLILSIYTFFWWVVGGAAFIRPNKYMKCFIATDLIAFLYFFYMLIHETYIVSLAWCYGGTCHRAWYSVILPHGTDRSRLMFSNWSGVRGNCFLLIFEEVYPEK
jgi:hypothetical protein